MEIIALPKEVTLLLNRLEAPERLKRHLQLVHNTANLILSQLRQVWPDININEDLILFGAATHDIGKVECRNELFEGGKTHELIGEQILLRQGFSEEMSRFARTHGNWNEPTLVLEDLLVCLSDKIWKGKRINDLEEIICGKIAELSKLNYWDIFTKLDLIIESICLESDQRILWQNEVD